MKLTFQVKLQKLQKIADNDLMNKKKILFAILEHNETRQEIKKQNKSQKIKRIKIMANITTNNKTKGDKQ